VFTFLYYAAKAALKGNKVAPVELLKCVLNSDVFFKGAARMIEALQTGSIERIVYVATSLYPGHIDECKKCLHEE